MLKTIFLFSTIALISGRICSNTPVGSTEITPWQYGKTGAVSLTFDDGIRTQFQQILPIMERLKFPATFFVITGTIKGSNYPSKFIGRPFKEIINETASIPTNKDNFFERASAARYLGFKGTLAYYDRTSELYESGRIDSAFNLIDQLYDKVRDGELNPGTDTSMEIANETGLSWDDLKQYASQGNEIASHTITHEHLAIMDSVNMMYELQKSQQDIQDHLGSKYTFSAEVPFGIDDPRVMKSALGVYAALRNLMPEPYMKEINRGERAQPGSSDKAYVQWQRGPETRTSLSRMESWVDTTLAHQNIWLVLVFHGVDSVGWQPLTHELIDTYFQYIKKNEPDLWIATFGEVAKYMRERMDTHVQDHFSSHRITVSIHQSLDAGVYNIPLTMKTYVPEAWKRVQISQGNNHQQISSQTDSNGTYVLYQADPNAGPIGLSEK